MPIAKNVTRRQLLDDQLAANAPLRNGNGHHDDDQLEHEIGEREFGQDKANSCFPGASVAHAGGARIARGDP